MQVGGPLRLTRTLASSALAAALITTSSFVGLAQTPLTGELVVAGPGVIVNGEAGANGRTLITPSNIITQGSSSATLNFGRVGRIQVSPASTFTIDGTGDILRGTLSAGAVTVVSAANPVLITTLCGKTVTANAGDTVDANAVCGISNQGPQTTARGGGGTSPLLYLVLVGAAVGVLAGVAGGGSGGGGSTSPTT